ncbi:AbrB/MazE/SpoVT family DNA-binding domain-containing protein [Candidatus Roizmanbacteria bacterium]|nr:AbrB/MazE/SpoVT family DNA-binding domain-containing protein [Candidatus Roizmanbacteria bacterium]
MIQQKIQTVSTKGQVVIPAEFRKILNIEPSVKVLVRIVPEKKEIVLKPMGDPIKELSGILKGKTKQTAQQFKDQWRKEEALL